MEGLNYQRDVKIEQDALDLEWLKHPHRYMLYAEAAAKANDLVRKKKNDLEIIDAKIDKEVRESMEGKVTENAVKAKVIEDDRHLKALIEYNDSLYQAELCASAVKAMDHKKAALQALVQLIAIGYTAAPKVPRNLKEEVNIEEQGIEKVKGEARERISRRRNKGEKNDENN